MYRGLCRPRRCAAAGGKDYGDLALDQFGGKGRQPLRLPLPPPILDVHVSPFNETGFLEALEKACNEGYPRLRRTDAERPNDWKRSLLCARNKRPAYQTTKCRKELTPFHLLPGIEG
jgi:hypothetical protein